ncbi:N-acetyltransferase [Fomitopsis serialis]|uniref:N-acetyltransferase n=1 Tax=Fomitopsis serialis TaxID=139415 RepID=UPI002008D07F|nr:N-acetyltransferase [Neoantrodia serialis]KAH9914960.1 N-acetyltransferase [Neoantrodia serialis]
MSVTRPSKATDMFRFNHIDRLVSKYGINFYLGYLSRWPDLCSVEESSNGRMMGYIIGKAEGQSTEWHGHITALTVAPEYRHLSLARKMTDYLERVSDHSYHGFFVDLGTFGMYEGLEYSVYRRVQEYYGSLGLGRNAKDEEDVFDMRKPLSRDPTRRSVRPNGREISVSSHDVS